MDLNSKVARIDKVGPKYSDLLANLGISTIEDLLYHFPHRYDDYSVIKTISEIKEGEGVTVTGILGPVENIYTKYGKKLTKGSITDHTGTLGIIWFNQHYLKTIMKPGEKYNISGTVSTFANKKVFISPDFEELKTNNLNTGRLVPVYPETAGLSSKWLRSRINDVLSQKLDMPEILPDIILNKENLIEFTPAINQIHFPNNQMEITNSRKRFEFEEMFLELLNMEKKRESWKANLKGNALEHKDSKITKFVASLPFKLTDSQEKAYTEILDDMCKETPMNRLLEGDVGSGKTVVAVIAAYLAYLNGKKTLYMAPTEILAKQHFETFSKLLGGTKAKVDLHTSNNKPSENFDILIGTHAVLFKEVNYTDIALVIIDEQHRFGVEQRGKILEITKQDGITPHFLSMTATPIPRTLALTVFGDLEISTLQTLPNKDKKITTKVIPPKLRDETYAWIKERNEQTFIVCPLIEESESISLENVKAAEKEFIHLRETIFAGKALGLLHGRMKPSEKDAVINDFREGKIQILVSTPVVEVGIDIPEATVMVIESAERYGLASLHQLRGRVGRGKKEGFCFVMMSDSAKVSYARLKNLEEISNGMELAEIDMSIRGQGDIFGTMQHGFKQFRIASLLNVDLVKKAKSWAETIYKDINKYPLLSDKLTQRWGTYIKNN